MRRACLFLWPAAPRPVPLTRREEAILVEVDAGILSVGTPSSPLGRQLRALLEQRRALEEWVPPPNEPAIPVAGHLDGVSWGWLEVNPDASGWDVFVNGGVEDGLVLGVDALPETIAPRGRASFRARTFREGRRGTPGERWHVFVLDVGDPDMDDRLFAAVRIAYREVASGVVLPRLQQEKPRPRRGPAWPDFNERVWQATAGLDGLGRASAEAASSATRLLPALEAVADATRDDDVEDEQAARFRAVAEEAFKP